MRKMLMAVVSAFVMVAFAAEPAKGPATPFDEYEKAMASNAKHPKAVEWQAANSAELAKLDDAWADGFLAGGRPAIDVLLAEVKPGYATDAMKATQIAVLTQRTMARLPCPWWKFWADGDHPARAMWASRLLAFAAESNSTDVKLFFLDQLRWCGYPTQAKDIRAIKGDAAVSGFAEMVAAELEGR